ncbi:MAG: DMT family transporter [Burkholderiales bacterium]|nr:DMT family transporter [Bacteroidia bacterium]
MTSSAKAHISLFIAQVIYALNYSIAKDLMPDQVSPLGLVMMRISGACLLFWIVSFFYKPEKIEKGDFKKLMILALFGVFINQVFFIWGLSLTKPINSAIIMVSNPIAVMLFTLFIFKEKLTALKLTGLAFGVIGALTLLLFKSHGSFSIGSETIVGDLMTLANSLSWAVFVVMAKPYMQKYQTVTVMKWIFLFGFIYICPFGTQSLTEVKWSTLLPYTIFAMAFVVVATTFLAYLLNTYALKALSSSVVSMYIYMQPFLATLIAIILGKDELTVIKIVSASLIITGVYLASLKKKPSV